MAKQYISEIKEMETYLTHPESIKKEAFNEIAKIFLQYYDQNKKQRNQYLAKEEINPVKWVCNASMGHGKTSVLVCFLKWLVTNTQVPILLVIREIKMAEGIEQQLSEFQENCVINVNKDNKEEVLPFVPEHQIVIITHSRLDNLVLGYGKARTYQQWFPFKSQVGSSDAQKKVSIRRMMIVDEKPSFENSSIFDIGSKNNAIDWFEKLALGIKEIENRIIQGHKSTISYLINQELAHNKTDLTRALAPRSIREMLGIKKLLTVISELKKCPGELEHKKLLKHFEMLLKKDAVGKIDECERVNNEIGRKIMVSECINYSRLKMNMLVLDGTADITWDQYGLNGFNLRNVKNYNNYTRLHLIQDNICTSKSSRDNAKKSVQETISERIIELRKSKHPDMFVLPMKSDKQFYMNSGAIPEEDFTYYTDSDTQKGLNLLNTIGKNMLGKRTSLYLTSLPRMAADFYKTKGIAIHGTGISIEMDSSNESLHWFKDEKMESIYKCELYAEILQIIHRTALRNIEGNDDIYIYIASDYLTDSGGLLYELENWYCKGMDGQQYDLYNYGLYHMDEGIEALAENSKKWFDENKAMDKVRISKCGKKLPEWCKNHWDKHQDKLNNIFAEYGLIVFEHGKGKYKYVATLEHYRKLYHDPFVDYLKTAN